ncbi:MAG: TlpA family protein disulfide reductase [Sporomusaceae bacterium]|nr:TlpA family protein disulfide reductase [Sporomusaceae bacterium]
MRKPQFIMGMIVSFLLIFCSIGSAAPVIGATVGKTVPQFTLPSLDGQNIIVWPSNNITILNFWATWCPPCRSEMPELNEFFLQYGDKVTFYAINLGEEFKVVNEFMYLNRYSIPVLLDSDGDVGKLFRIQYIPTTIIVDRNGIIKYRKSGPVTKTELEDVVSQL